MGAPGDTYLALSDGAHVNQTVNRGSDLGVAQPDVRLGLLSRGGGLHVLIGFDLVSPRRHLLGIGPRERNGRTLGIDLLDERVELRLRRVGGRAGLIELLGRGDALLSQTLSAGVNEARVLQIGGRRLDLRVARREHRLGLLDLIGGLTLLEPERGFGLANLRRQPLAVLRVVSGVGLQFVGSDYREQLPFLDRVSFLHEELRNLAGDLRAHDHVVGRHDAGEQERGGGPVRVDVSPDRHGNDYERHDESTRTLHKFKQVYQTLV